MKFRYLATALSMFCCLNLMAAPAVGGEKLNYILFNIEHTAQAA